MISNFKNLLFVLLLINLFACGGSSSLGKNSISSDNGSGNNSGNGSAGSGSDSGSDDGSGSGDPAPSEVVNIDKLIGTPFESLVADAGTLEGSNLVYGDSFADNYFVCGQYKTDTIDTFPIKIFAALFWDADDDAIQEGIALANDAIGFTAYEYTETWSDDVRVIYAVSENSIGAGAGAETRPVYHSFNGTNYSEVITPDWAIIIEKSGRGFIDKYEVAHELGHATGIQNHQLIVYEDDTRTDLENNSLMTGGNIDLTDPALTDYYYMMSQQGQIMANHLGASGDYISGKTCD